MGQDGFGPDDVEPEEVESRDVETTDGAWQESRGRGGARWLLLLLVIPVVALVVLQLQPSGEPSAVSTPTKSSSPTKFSSPSSPAPTRGRASAMSTGQPVVQNLGHPLLGADQDWELYARGDRAVVRIQMARGRVTTTPVPALVSTGPVAFVATAAGAVVRPLDFVSGYLVPDGGPARELTGLLGQGGPVVPGPDPDHLWVQTGNLDGGSIQLVTLAGRPAGTELPVPANANDFITAGGAGDPLVTTTGGAYDVRPGGLHRITTGTIEAVGPTGWLVVECDDANHCSRVVVDHATGKRTRLTGQVNAEALTPGLISPDGSLALVVDTATGTPRMTLVDLDSGDVHTVDVDPRGRTFLGQGSAAWSPDSRWVLLADDRGVLVAVDARTRAVHRLKIDLPDVNQVAVRHPK